MTTTQTTELAALITERDDLRDLLVALGDALDAGVRVKAIRSAIATVLIDATGEVEASMVLRRLARSRSSRRSA
jgi:hypothetical protein